MKKNEGKSRRENNNPGEQQQFYMYFPLSFDCGKHISIIHKGIVDTTATGKR
jgi:hypothetical protein